MDSANRFFDSRLMRSWPAVLAVVAVHTWVAGAAATLVPVSNYHWVMGINAFNANLSSIDIDYNGAIYSTGPISVSLDPEYVGDSNYFDADLSDGSVTIDYYLQASCPLLSSLGAPPQKYHVVTSGGPGSLSVSPAMVADDAYTVLTVSVLQPLTSLGEFAPGQLFGGWQYQNHAAPPPAAPVRPMPPRTPRPIDPFLGIDNTAMITAPLEIHDVKLISPTGSVYQPVFYGGTVTYSAIPEPATLSLFALGGLALMRRRR